MDVHLSIKENLEKVISQISNPKVQDIEKIIFSILGEFAAEGKLSFGDEYSLKGKPLELRVKYIFRMMGFIVEDGRDGFEDAIVRYQKISQTLNPLVLEIKSSKSSSPNRDDLRQLDDYVFELSGEEKARKEGLGGGIDTLSFASSGLLSQRHYHPSPHKGIFIFNGPTSTPFNKRPPNWIGNNEIEFAKKRNFCLLSFKTLIEVFEKYQQDVSISIRLWDKMHSTQGELLATDL